MNTRWVLLNDAGGVERVLSPAGANKFTRDRDLSIGCIGYRRKLAGSLSFVKDDYAYFLTFETKPNKRCKEFTVRFQIYCDAKWHNFWDGTFSTGSGTWDRASCRFDVRPDAKDKYSCIIKALNKKVNVLQVAPVDASAVIVPSLDFAVCRPGLPIESTCPGIFDVDGTTPINEYETAHTQFVDYDCGAGTSTYDLTIYWREKQTTFCVAGAPVAPVGAGWVLLEDNCAIDGTSVYVRNSTIPWTFGDATITFSDSTTPVPPNDSCAWTYLGMVDINEAVDPFCIGFYNHAWICLASGDPVEYSRARPLMDALEYQLSQTGCAYAGVSSDFFEHNPIGDAQGYEHGINYVTGEANEVNNLILLQNSDAVDPSASNPATIGELTLKDTLFMLLNYFRVFWDIDQNNNLRLEHWKYWSFPVGLDLAEYPDTVEHLTYSHLNSDIPRYERVKTQHALNMDFEGADVIYSGPCVTSQDGSDLKEYNIGPFMTDLSMVISDPDAIDLKGFVMLATSYNGSVYNTLLKQGALSGNFVTNAPVSTANVQANYWSWDRFLPSGNLNRQDVTFDAYIPNIEQKGVSVPMCCAIVKFKATDRVVSRLTGLVGSNAFVQREEFDASNGRATYTLRYPY